jgi:hypothetical protein
MSEVKTKNRIYYFYLKQFNFMPAIILTPNIRKALKKLSEDLLIWSIKDIECPKREENKNG